MMGHMQKTGRRLYLTMRQIRALFAEAEHWDGACITFTWDGKGCYTIVDQGTPEWIRRTIATVAYAERFGD